MRPLGLRWRVSICAAVTLLLTVCAISVLAYVEFRHLLKQYIDDTLLVVSQGDAAIMDDAPDAKEPAEIEAMMGVVKESPLYEYRIWVDGDAQDVYASRPVDGNRQRLVEALEQQEAPAVGEHRFFGEGLGPGGYRAIWLHARTFRGPTNIVVARFGNIQPREIRTFVLILLPVAASIVVLAVVATLLLVGWALRPIQRTARQIGNVTVQNVGRTRVNSRQVPDELRPFVASLSAMLARLDKAFASQKQLVANASHELRTPLALAKSTLQAARSRDRDVQTYQQMMDDALGDLVRMEHLIEELLTLAKLDETAGVPNATEVDLDVLLHHVAERFLSDPGFDGRRLVCRIEPARVKGNEGQLSRLFSNLVDNAIKHGPCEGRVLLSTTVAADHVSVCVHDEGGRIPAESIPVIFDRFVRLDRSRSNATGGAGLGLSIAREIALRHGGEIGIRSEPEAGTSITVRLPRAFPESPEACARA